MKYSYLETRALCVNISFIISLYPAKAPWMVLVKLFWTPPLPSYQTLKLELKFQLLFSKPEEHRVWTDSWLYCDFGRTRSSSWAPTFVQKLAGWHASGQHSASSHCFGALPTNPNVSCRCKISRSLGTSASVVGGSLTIAGGVLTVTTAGAAAPLLIAGIATRCQSFKTFLRHHCRWGPISWRVCPWKPYPFCLRIWGQGQRKPNWRTFKMLPSLVSPWCYKQMLD
jgi:hypothetical protein